MLVRLQLEAGEPAAEGSHEFDTVLIEPLLALRLAREDADAAEIERAADAMVKRFADAPVPADLVGDATTLARRAHAEANLIQGDLVTAADVLGHAIDDSVLRTQERQVADATALFALVTALSSHIRQASALADELGDTWTLRSRCTTACGR